jgi:uncharacterized protein YbbC (DUF1343 family)
LTLCYDEAVVRHLLRASALPFLLAAMIFAAIVPAPLAAQSVRSGVTLAGIDVLEQQNFAPLRGKRVGLITNHTGVTRDGRSTIDVLVRAPGVRLAALFSPEHGIRGDRDEQIESGRDAATGLPIHSLYGQTLRPTDAMLEGLDALVFDMQDAGVRFYTYVTTMAYAMEAAARRGLPFFVLDRPNPIGGVRIEGPVLDGDKLSFTGYFPMPVRTAMTLGELARMFNAENKIGCELHVIALRDWRRADWFDATGLRWVNPSPNLRSLDAAALYPGLEILQAADVSVGRGTTRPFELFGAPWIRGAELAERLNSRNIPGMRFAPTELTPDSGLHAGERCQGATVEITDRSAIEAMRMGLEIAAALRELYPEQFDVAKILSLLGNSGTIERLRRGETADSVVRSWDAQLEAFRQMRAKYLLYR